MHSFLKRTLRLDDARIQAIGFEARRRYFFTLGTMDIFVQSLQRHFFVFDFIVLIFDAQKFAAKRLKRGNFHMLTLYQKKMPTATIPKKIWQRAGA